MSIYSYGFEDDGLDDWSSSAQCSASFDDTKYHSGTHSMKVTASGASPYVSKGFDASAPVGKNAKLSAWVYQTDGNSGNLVLCVYKVIAGTWDYLTSGLTVFDEWVLIEGIWQVTEATFNMTIWEQNGVDTDTFWVDDASIEYAISGGVIAVMGLTGMLSRPMGRG